MIVYKSKTDEALKETFSNRNREKTKQENFLVANISNQSLKGQIH